MSVTKVFSVETATRSNLKESYCESYEYDFSNEKDGTRIIKVDCFDKTNSHRFVYVTITRNTEEQCYDEMSGQETDGIFENEPHAFYVNEISTPLWYAVMRDDDDDDWGTGSYDLEKAKKMLKAYPEGYIAVIDNGVCIKEIR